MSGSVTIARVLGMLCPVAMALLALVAPVRAESPFTLTVRLYNGAALPPDDISAAIRAAEPILTDTGIAVTFRRCGRAADLATIPADPCDDALKSHEVVVRLIDAPKVETQLDPLAFGLTYVVAETNRGWLATVFADRVRATAVRVRMDHGTLAGLVLAHEVGHLLLGQGYHGQAGVMRAEWPDQLLTAPAVAEWRFSMRETALIQQRLIAR